MEKKIDTRYTPLAICPYCEHEHEDCWDWKSESAEMNCESCGKIFFYEKHIEVTYTTLKIEE